MFLGEVIMSGKGFYVIYEELVTLQQASVIGQGLAWWQGISYAARGGGLTWVALGEEAELEF